MKVLLISVDGMRPDALPNCELAEKYIKEILSNLHAKTKDIIQKKRPYLDALTEALVEKEVVLGTEIEEIFKKVALEIGDEELTFNHSTSEK